jgi:23S rRNA pseudouridine1911/1915/1917 synthase
MSRKWILTVPEGVKDRADKALIRLLEEEEEAPALSRSQLQKLMDSDRVISGGTPVRGKDRLTPGSEISIEIPDPAPLDVSAEDIPLDILFEDEHLLVVNKQPGLTVHPSETQKSGTLVNALLFRIKDLSGIGGVLRPGIVHRIDKDTSGALVVSKTDAAHAGLAALFGRHDIERRYWAFCYGSPRWEGDFRFESTLGRSPQDRKKMAVNVENGRKAVSVFRNLGEFSVSGKSPYASWIEARLMTGRTHQVRVHLTHLQHSLLGDPVYGTPTESQAKWKLLPLEIQRAVRALSGQALHARVLGFRHPVTGAELRFEAPLPPALQALVDLLAGTQNT